MSRDLPRALRKLTDREREDLTFHFQVTPTGLSAKQRERWYRIGERLTGRERALPAYFRNSLGCRNPLFSAAAACGAATEDRAQWLDKHYQQTDSPEERQEANLLLAAADTTIARELFDAWHVGAPGDDQPWTPRREFTEISVADAARRMQVDETTIRRMIADGYLSQSRRGYVRLDLAKIREFHARWNRGGAEGANLDRQAIAGRLNASDSLPPLRDSVDWQAVGWVKRLLREARGARSSIVPGDSELTLSELRELSGLSTERLRVLLMASGKRLSEGQRLPREWFHSPEGQAFLEAACRDFADP